MPPTARTSTARTSTARTGNTGTATGTATAPADTGRRGARRGPGADASRRVAAALREQIATGALPPAAPLPSEAQLMAAHGVSRNTARAAIATLAGEGLVTTLHGRGSFVRRTGDRPALTHPRAITRTRARGGTGGTGATLRDAELDDPRWQPVEKAATYRTAATADLAYALGLPEGAPLFAVDRLLADPAGRRLFHRLYVPFAVAVDVPALEDDPFRTPGDLYTVLAAAGHKLHWTETVRARMPSPDDANTLRIPTGTPLLLTRRTTHDATPGALAAAPGRDGRPLALEETHLSAEDAQLSYALAAAPAVK